MWQCTILGSSPFQEFLKCVETLLVILLCIYMLTGRDNFPCFFFNHLQHGIVLILAAMCKTILHCLRLHFIECMLLWEFSKGTELFFFQLFSKEILKWYRVKTWICWGNQVMCISARKKVIWLGTREKCYFLSLKLLILHLLCSLKFVWLSFQ